MESYQRLVEIIKKLRSENGCAWDKIQTKESLVPALIEESYEVIEAIDENDFESIKEELGDLIFLSTFITYILEQDERFTIEEVINNVCDKLIRRHPHVFANENITNPDDTIKRWEEIKMSETKNKKRKFLFDGIPKRLPEILKFNKYLKKIKNSDSDFDFNTNNIEILFKDFINGKNYENFIESLLIYCYNSKIDILKIIRKILKNYEKNFNKKL